MSDIPSFSMDCDQTTCSESYRSGLEPLSLYDSNSRDSGFDEAPLESIADEDDFLEEFSEFSVCESLPTDFSNLIKKPIITVTVRPDPTAFSLDETVSPQRKKICQRSAAEEESFIFRRRKLLRKSRTAEYGNAVVPSGNVTFLSSENEIKTAIQRSYSEPDLIADFTRSYSLPSSTSRHQDLRAIDTTTLNRLLNGELRVPSFKVIDCRYPYEYEGGHIEGALNIYTHDQCSALLEEAGKPSILIFHCEFSAERGPNLYRYLRQEDRKRNVHRYPALCFPEIYILEGGYRKFFEENSVLCCPSAYTQMLDPKFSNEMDFFRQTSRTWDSDVKNCCKKIVRSRTVRKFVL
ncbi:M-phase inducer phosphatase-like isoform X1 [Euwallacea similis]|uniref:M-phase inducer phosphatase-like isoform X1 n=1 Tax=Euwallacea similis TaxID=1736056 RepID=UPI00344CBBE5